MLVLISPLLVIGCKKEKPLAPTEMTDIVRYMFDNFEDEEALGAAIDNLDPWLQANATSEDAMDGYRLDPLTSDDTDSVATPNGTSLGDLLGAAGGNESAYGLAAQAEHIIDTDQVWANDKYDIYSRRFVGEVGPSDFKKREGVLRTVNDVTTTSFTVTIPYKLYKDYRWVETEGGLTGIVARSWIEEEGCNDGGNNCLRQSFSVDHFHGDGNGTLRLTATWSEVAAVIDLPDDVLIDGLADGLQNTFENTEEYLDAR
jgi:hypothetical protein